jgi:hypothetical protein
LFFFEKKNQKTLELWRARWGGARAKEHTFFSKSSAFS